MRSVNNFYPSDIDDCELWLDALDGTTLFEDSSKTTPVRNVGSVVQAWEDKSGNGNDFLHNTDSPSLAFDNNSGFPGVWFDGGGEHLRCTNGALVTGYPFTLISVLQPWGTNDDYYFWMGDASSATLYWYAGVFGTAFLTGHRNGGFDSAQATQTFTANRNYIVFNEWSGNTSRSVGVFGNGELVENTGASTTPSGWDQTTIGRLDDSSPGFGWYGYMYELCGYSALLTSAEKNKIGRYLQRKYTTTWVDF